MIDKATLASIEKARAEYIASLQPQRPGKDWFTAAEYAEAEGMKTKSASERLQAMRAGGFFESRRVGHVMFWRVKP